MKIMSVLVVTVFARILRVALLEAAGDLTSKVFLLCFAFVIVFFFRRSTNKKSLKLLRRCTSQDEEIETFTLFSLVFVSLSSRRTARRNNSHASRCCGWSSPSSHSSFTRFRFVLLASFFLFSPKRNMIKRTEGSSIHPTFRYATSTPCHQLSSLRHEDASKRT